MDLNGPAVLCGRRWFSSHWNQPIRGMGALSHLDLAAIKLHHWCLQLHFSGASLTVSNNLIRKQPRHGALLNLLYPRKGIAGSPDEDELSWS